MKIPVNILLTIVICVSLPAFGSGGRFYESYVEADYDIGKKVFYEKVVCASCPYADLEFESNKVAEILPELTKEGSIGKYFSLRERRSVELFLSRRFNL